MKKIIILALALVFAAPLMAQHGGPQHGKQRQVSVSELVDDLSSPQKHKIETISQKSKERVDALRKQQHAVRDSIALFMDRDGDQSKTLYPLFDREAKLKAAIDREMYTTKRQIDEVLTPQQRAALREKLRREHSRK